MCLMMSSMMISLNKIYQQFDNMHNLLCDVNESFRKTIL